MLYDVNTKRIEEQINFLEDCLAICDQFLQTEEIHQMDIFAVSRALHIAVECVIDVGSVMIDGFIMRDPGGYHDIVDILQDEQVIPSDLAERLKDWVNLREKLVRHYTEVEVEELTFKAKEAPHIRRFATYVRNYLSKELV